MTPGSLVLLHAPGATSASWGDVPEMLRSSGLDVFAPDVPEDAGVRYVARASLVIGAAGPAAPLVLAAYGAAGPLLPAIALAQRAAHRPVGGYVFVDADLPRALRAHDHDHDGLGEESRVPIPPDWPEAPCGYLRTLAGCSAQSGHDGTVREARLRGWPVIEQEPPVTVAQALGGLVATL
ncbi:hypothetical protein AGRA3207_003887 [Actinomadura graeca]|uniref:Alpha/beta hydrolase n=1 Tax=Actinomadura graeca TaxID=2750812 RepID=A0ABX8QXX0_9ACTN|nr:hypothetical protein [Actinomadura graeca]QXJ22824.1 hypothetical protein AGRA3207_003887 [Actinomadura graeca]